MPAGYSGTPLARKLTLTDGMTAWFDGMPGTVRAEILESGIALNELAGPSEGLDAAHVFVTRKAALEDALTRLRNCIAPTGQVWVSWPKKASGMASEVGEHEVRAAGLALGFVDTKKCAVDETWSGLKFVIRKALR